MRSRGRPSALGVHVVVSGSAGSGKTTAAVALAQALPATLLSKDLLKEVLSEPLDVHSEAESLRLSGAVMSLLFGLVGRSQVGLVLDANWKADIDVPRLRAVRLPL